jgi:hypothetical protein
MIAVRFSQLENARDETLPGEFCKVTSSKGYNFPLINFVFLLMTELMFIIPFLYRIYAANTKSTNHIERKKWIRLSVINILCVVLIIAVEFTSRFVYTFLKASGITLSFTNFLQANLVVFMIEDMKKQLICDAQNTMEQEL